MTLRLTFNKPMIARYFDGENSVAVRVKIEEGVALFLPVSDERRARDVLPLQVRKRGGAEAVIEGALEADLADALSNENGPFFTLQRRQGGWLAAVPWNRNSAPPKPEPHVRAWTTSSEERKSSHITTIENLPQLVKHVRDAKDRLDRFSASKRPGRPPKDILDARDALVMFEQLVREIMPETPRSPDYATLIQARDLINRVIGQVEKEAA